MLDHSNSVCGKSPGEIADFLFEMEIGPFKNAEQLWRWTISRVSPSDAIIRVSSYDASAADGFRECQVDVYGDKSRTGHIDYY